MWENGEEYVSVSEIYEIPSTVYNLSNTLRNKFFNYKDTVNKFSTDDTIMELV